MHAIIGSKLLASCLAQPAAKPFEIYDTRLPGFTLRIQPSGVRSFYARIGRNRRIPLGKVGDVLPDEAREKCQKVLGNFAHGRHRTRAQITGFRWHDLRHHFASRLGHDSLQAALRQPFPNSTPARSFRPQLRDHLEPSGHSEAP
jgi:hypothetical protein